MTQAISKHERNLSALIHASTFSKYFIPFGNLILPLIFWTANKKNHSFVDLNGKRALNFQISLLLYSLLLGVFILPFIVGFIPELLHHGSVNLFNLNEFNGLNFNLDFDRTGFGRILWPLGIAALIQSGLFIVNIVYTILATLRTGEGQEFKYPISIPFIR